MALNGAGWPDEPNACISKHWRVIAMDNENTQKYTSQSKRKIPLGGFAGLWGSQRKNFWACQNFGSKFCALLKISSPFPISHKTRPNRWPLWCIFGYTFSELASDQLLFFRPRIPFCQVSHKCIFPSGTKRNKLLLLRKTNTYTNNIPWEQQSQQK